MFGSDPVERSSRAKTSQPAASRSSARCDPMNPAPPVMSALGLLVSGVLNRTSLPRLPERLADVVRARVEREGCFQLTSCIRGAVGAQVRERELVAELDLARLLANRSSERRDVPRGGGESGLGLVGRGGERIEALGPAKIGGGAVGVAVGAVGVAGGEPTRGGT